jgi:nicotinate-nucleotide pyrophosphorylase (carboxylating)
VRKGSPGSKDGDGHGDLDAEVSNLVDLALNEDVGEGDWTTLWTVGCDTRAEALVVAKEALIVAGGLVVRRVFLAVDPDIEVDLLVSDGEGIEVGTSILRVKGGARGILTAERTALNFLGRLSGIATLTRKFVEAVEGHKARILDTRKTTPGWRALEKWAVGIGGGVNHRMGLDDMILVKDNHILAAGGVREAVLLIREQNETGLPIEVEIVRAEQVEELCEFGIDRILLDNMDEGEIRQVVTRVSAWPVPRPEIEASGNMTLERVRGVAETGVDWISVGALTHSVQSVDLSLQLTGSQGYWLPREGASLDPS